MFHEANLEKNAVSQNLLRNALSKVTHRRYAIHENIGRMRSEGIAVPRKAIDKWHKGLLQERKFNDALTARDAKTTKTSFHLNTVYNLGADAALADFNKTALSDSAAHLILGRLAPAGIGAGVGALAAGEGNRGTGALAGGALGAVLPLALGKSVARSSAASQYARLQSLRPSVSRLGDRFSAGLHGLAAGGLAGAGTAVAGGLGTGYAVRKLNE
jgi:hypothetical protein